MSEAVPAFSNPSNDFDWRRVVDTRLRWPVMVGATTIVAFVMGFFGWATTAPLSGAAVAFGTIAVEDRNVRIQHLEGGIVAEIVAREGEQVEAGAPLVVLDRSAAEANLARLESRLLVLRAQEARLVSEWEDTDLITFPASLRSSSVGNSEITDLMEVQSAEYAARRSRHIAETQILNERIGAFQREIAGHEAELAARHEQLAITEEEILIVSDLFDRGLANIDRLLSLRRSAADFRGRIGNTGAQIAILQRNITEVHEQIASAETGRVEATLEALTEVRSEIADVERQRDAAADAVDRIVIRAPLPGTLVKLDITTPGAVVAPGGLVAEVLPRDAPQLVELRLAPQDVDVVHPGQAARLRLTALNQRITPTVAATVTYISADRLFHEATGESFYEVRLRIDDPLPPTVTPSDLRPGMQVEAFIGTGERTFMDYLLRPITDSFARAFREE